MLWKFTLLSPLLLPSLSVQALWHAKSADFIFLPPVVRKCPFQGSQVFPPWLSKPYLCLDCFSISNKRQRRDYHSTSFHTLSFKWQRLRIYFLFIYFFQKKHCLVAFCFFFFSPSSLSLLKSNHVKRTVVELRAQHQQRVWGLFSSQVLGADFVAEDNKVSSGLLSEMLTSS